MGVHGNDTVDALAEAHDHRDETRFRDVTPHGDDPARMIASFGGA